VDGRRAELSGALPSTQETLMEMKNEAQPQHRWLQQLVGEWTYESECVMEPGKPPETFSGTETVRPIGDLWVLCEGRGEMPGGGLATMLITLGYNPNTERYVGTFVGSMMSHLWIYDGWLDAAGTLLTLEAEGPSFAGDGSMAKYHDLIEIKSPDHHVLSSQVLGEGGEWTRFMTANYRRRK
jgi:hypothetical protein